MQGAGVLAQDLHAHRALPGDHIGIVESGDEGQVLRARQILGVGVSVAVRIARLHHRDGGTAMRLHGIHLDLRRGLRHHDDGAHAHLGGRDGHALGMVAGRCGDHAPVQRRPRRIAHLVVGASHLE
ncbi:hypothetical protein FQZ97_918860 [compost metagenome]